jgi:hypothetical protein
MGFERSDSYQRAVLCEASESARGPHEETFEPVAPICGFRNFDNADTLRRHLKRSGREGDRQGPDEYHRSTCNSIGFQ